MQTELSKRWAWAAWAALVALYLLIRLPLLQVPLDRDEGAFGCIAQAIWRGEWPYREVTDLKPPGVFYSYALALAFVPPTAPGVHLFLLVWNFGTLLCTASIASALRGRRAGLWTAFFFAWISAAPSLQGFTASTEMFLLLPLAASFRLALAGRNGGRRRTLWLLASGALGAGACWIKPTAAFPLLIVPLVLALRNARARGGAGWRGGLRAFGTWLAGGTGLSLLVCLPFIALGIFDQFFYWSFQHGFLYGAFSWKGPWIKRLGERLPFLALDLALPLALGVGLGLWGLWRRWKHSGLGLAFLGLSILSAVYSGFFYFHYFAQLAPALSLAAGLGAAGLVESLRASGRGKIGAPAVTAGLLLLSLGSAVVLRPWYWLRPNPVEVSWRTLGRQSFEAGPMLAYYLRQRMKPNEWMFIYGSEPQIPFLANRRNANPYVMAYPLTRNWPRSREFQERAWEMIRKVRPLYLVLPMNPASRSAAPGRDRFFEQKLTALVERVFRLEALLVEDPKRGYVFWVGRIRDAQRRALKPYVRFELWRRIAAPEGKRRNE